MIWNTLHASNAFISYININKSVHQKKTIYSKKKKQKQNHISITMQNIFEILKFGKFILNRHSFFEDSKDIKLSKQ